MSDGTMRTVTLDGYGGPDVLRLSEVPRPEPDAGQVLVRVHASSINPVDYKVRQGDLRMLTMWHRPMRLGSDFAGEIVAVGTKVERLRIGDRVFGAVNPTAGGAYAEYVAADEAATARIPDGGDWTDAAAAPIAGLTALMALRDRADLQSGARVLINGASGGVGTYAVQIAQILGAGQIVGTASADATELLRSLGADRVIDYANTDFTREDATYDIILDAAGKSSYTAVKRVLAPDGVYATTLPGPGNLLAQAGNLFREQKAENLLVRPKTDDLRQLAEWMEQGRLRSVIDRVFPLDRIAEAQRYAEEEHPRGKVVIRVL